MVVEVVVVGGVVTPASVKLRKFNNIINQIPCDLISMQAIPTSGGGGVGGWRVGGWRLICG